MAVHAAHSALRLEIISIGPIDIPVYFFYDPDLGEWLSVEVFTLSHARNANNYTGFLRYVNGVVETTSFGPVVPHDAKVVWMSAISGNTLTNRRLDIHSGGAVVGSLTWSGAPTVYSGMNVDIDEGDNVSVEVVVAGIGTGTVDNPIVLMGLRWRL